MNVLFLAYYFPPDSSSGSFRPFFFANRLAKSGVGVHVLTAKVEDFLPEKPLDSALSDKLNPSVEVTRCSVWRPREAVISLRNQLTVVRRVKLLLLALLLQAVGIPMVCYFEAL